MSIELDSPEGKAAIKAAVEEATAALAAKNKELLGELKEARKGKAINPEDLEKLESRIEELQGQLTEAQKTAKTATKEAEKATKALADAEGFTQRLLVDNGLTDALTKAGVSNPVHLKAAKALLSGQVQIVADGDSKVAKVGEKALADYIGEWAKGDEGKFFVAAPNNSGGGANGGSGGSGNKTPGSLKEANSTQERIAVIRKRLEAEAASGEG
jgi:hypothetical protein